MPKNIIAIILPEYKDNNNSCTASDWTTNEMYDDSSIGEQIKELGQFVDFFSDEDCTIIYDLKNVKAFLYAADTLPECYPSRVIQLISILKNITNWRTNRISSENDTYQIYYKTIRDEIRTEIASCLNKSPSDSYIIATTIFGREEKTWSLDSDSYKTDVYSRPLFIPAVFDWLSKNHKPNRVYKWNKKHGENGKRAHPDNNGKKVSVLLCSIKHAEELLPKAIGEPMYDFLYCFDTNHNKYMEYPAGCKYDNLPKNTTEREYHSYHIDNYQEVPQRVRKKIGLLQKLTNQP